MSTGNEIFNTYIEQPLRCVKKFLLVERRAQFLHLAEQRREHFEHVGGQRVQVDLVRGYNFLSLRLEHLEDLEDVSPLVALHNSVSLFVRLVDLPSSLRGLRDLLALRLLLPRGNRLMLPVEVLPDREASTAFLSDAPFVPGTAARLRPEQRLAGLRVDVFVVVREHA